MPLSNPVNCDLSLSNATYPCFCRYGRIECRVLNRFARRTWRTDGPGEGQATASKIHWLKAGLNYTRLLYHGCVIQAPFLYQYCVILLLDSISRTVL